MDISGDRNDSECYQEAHVRVQSLNKDQPQALGLAAVMLELTQLQKSRKRTKARRT